MFQWITIFTALVAVTMLGIAMNEVSLFNDRCTDNGIELRQCYSDRINEMRDQMF